MSSLPKGGSFLFKAAVPADVFTPEDFEDEHRMLSDTVSHFLTERVFAQMDDLDAKKDGLMRQVLVEAGELGLLGADIPERFGGTEADEICSTIIAEKVGAAGSFAISHGGHTGIGNLPIVYFGNEAQKAAYLPSIATAEKVSAYALTEPGSGSDALSATTKAVLSDDGKHYILNGGKTFISNAGMADIFIVYAKIDGDKFSAFIVDGHAEGLTTGAEEHKMGLKGSSTRSVFSTTSRCRWKTCCSRRAKGMSSPSTSSISAATRSPPMPSAPPNTPWTCRPRMPTSANSSRCRSPDSA